MGCFFGAGVSRVGLRAIARSKVRLRLAHSSACNKQGRSRNSADPRSFPGFVANASFLSARCSCDGLFFCERLRLKNRVAFNRMIKNGGLRQAQPAALPLNRGLKRASPPCSAYCVSGNSIAGVCVLPPCATSKRILFGTTCESALPAGSVVTSQSALLPRLNDADVYTAVFDPAASRSADTSRPTSRSNPRRCRHRVLDATPAMVGLTVLMLVPAQRGRGRGSAHSPTH